MARITGFNDFQSILDGLQFDFGVFLMGVYRWFFNVAAKHFVYLIKSIIFGIVGAILSWFCPAFAKYIKAYVIWGAVSAIVTLCWWEYLILKVENVHKRHFAVPPIRVPWFPTRMGILERIIYTTLIGFNVPAAAAFIGGWVTIKAIGGWATWAQKDHPYGKALFFSGLLGSAMSVIFGLIAGLYLFRSLHPELPPW